MASCVRRRKGNQTGHRRLSRNGYGSTQHGQSIRVDCCTREGPTLLSTLSPYTTLFRSQLADAQSSMAAANQLMAQQTAAANIAATGLDVRRRGLLGHHLVGDRKSTRLNSSHPCIAYGVLCSKKKRKSDGT